MRGWSSATNWPGKSCLSSSLGWYVWRYPLAPNLPGASTTLPFFKYLLVVPVAGVYVLFTTFVLTGVRATPSIYTDGLDGLAAGLSAIAFATLPCSRM